MRRLLDEERFAKLISAHERLHSAESTEEVLDFAVLVDLLGGTQYGRRNNLQRVRIRNAVALKSFGLFAVKQGEDHTTGAKQFGEIRYGLFCQRGLQIIEQIPHQDGVER